jgi:hypothetical protein
MALLVGAERAARFLGRPSTACDPKKSPQGSLTPVWQALARRTVRLRVETPPLELELCALTALRVGDVLLTSHTLDTPLAVSVHVGRRPGEPLCRGFLGRSGGIRAVELLPNEVAAAAAHEPSNGHEAAGTGPRP